jgi:hypothetical protein
VEFFNTQRCRASAFGSVNHRAISAHNHGGVFLFLGKSRNHLIG